MKKRNFLAVLASCAVVAGMMPMTVSAAKYAPVAGDSEKANFDKYLVIDEQANVPNVSFEYTVAAGTAQAFNADKKTIEIYAGPTPENILFTGDVVADTNTTDKKFEIAAPSTNHLNPPGSLRSIKCAVGIVARMIVVAA